MRIPAGVGRSTCSDNAYEAGVEAARAALGDLGQERPELLVVFTTPSLELEELIKGIRSIGGDVPLVGCTTSGEIVKGEYMGFGAGVAVMALGAGKYRYGLASEADIKGRLDEAGREIARRSKEAAGSSPHAAVLLLVDCLAGDLQELFRGVYRITGPKVSITRRRRLR